MSGNDPTIMIGPDNTELDEAIDSLMEAAKSKAESEIKKDKAFDSEGNPVNGSVNDYDKEKIQEGLDDLRARFDKVYTPHPKEFLTLVEAMTKIETALGVNIGDPDDLDENLTDEQLKLVRSAEGSDGLDGISVAKGEISANWDGQLRNNLLNRLGKMSKVGGNQGALAKFLKVQAQLMARVYDRRRADAKKTAEDAKTAIEAIKDSSGSDLAILLAVVISVGTVATGGAVLLPAVGQVVATLAGSTAIIGGTLGGPFLPDDEEVPLGADNVEDVVSNVYEALNKSDETMEKEEEQIMKALSAIEELVAPTVAKGAYEGTSLVPAWPDMTKILEPEKIREKFTSWAKDGDDDDGGDDDDDDEGDGRGSYKGPNPPDDWDGSVDDTSDDDDDQDR